MRNLLLALLHLAVVSAKLCGAGGVRATLRLEAKPGEPGDWASHE